MASRQEIYNYDEEEYDDYNGLSEMALEIIIHMSPQEKDEILKQDINPGLRRIHESLPEQVILAKLKAASQEAKDDGQNISRPALCARFVRDNVAEALTANANTAYLEMDPPVFAAWRAMYEGVYESMFIIGDTEDCIRVGVDSYIAELETDARESMGPLLSDYIARSRARAERNMKLLQDNDHPAGFALVDNLITQAVETDQSYFYVAGVDLAAARYKEAYKIAEANGI